MILSSQKKKNQAGGLNRNEKIFDISNFFFFSNVKAGSVQDYETEIFLNDILKLIISANQYKKNIDLTILIDDTPNAFVNEEDKLFISTGLLKYAESYEAVVGVLAHEIGHLEKFHVFKRVDSIKKLDKLNKFSNLTIIAGSLASNRSDILMESLITNQFGIRNYAQSFSRDQEREADYYAIETLNKLQLSTKPLVKFLNFLEQKSIQKGMTNEFYKFSSHPIYKERYNIISNAKSEKQKNFSQEFNTRFKFIQAKLFGFTANNKHDVSEYLNNDYQNYTKSIILSKESRLKESLKLLNNFIKKNPNNFFLYETKGDILYAGGYLEEAILFYNKSNQKYPNNNYVKKRVFDIKFSLIEKNNTNESLELFQEYIFLIELYSNNNDLKNKYKKLATNAKKKLWVNYFTIEENYFNKEIEKKEFIQKMNLIKNKTKDLNLINLINKHIKD